MEKIVKARKIYTCEYCNGNIQKGEKHIHHKHRIPIYSSKVQPKGFSSFDVSDRQIGIEYYEGRSHNRDCFPRLGSVENSKHIIKNCNNGIHSKTWDTSPDSDGSEWCEWCGKEL